MIDILRINNEPNSIWFHCSIIDIFRPFVASEDTQSSPGNASETRNADFAFPETVVAASIQQLQHLILTYLTRFQFSSRSTIFWHSCLMYVANDMLKRKPVEKPSLKDIEEEHGSEIDTDCAASSPTSTWSAPSNQSPRPTPSCQTWHFWFTLCIRSYSRLSTCFRVCESMVQGLLAMALEKDAIDNKEAMILIQELNEFGDKRTVNKSAGGLILKDNMGGEKSSQSFILDLDLAVTDGTAARVDKLVERFEQMTIFKEFTTGII
jgi:hypothetical protein